MEVASRPMRPRRAEFRQRSRRSGTSQPHGAPVSGGTGGAEPVEEPVHQQEEVSTTDPDSTYATKGGMPARLGYYDNYLVDNHSCVIMGVQATAARVSQETVGRAGDDHSFRPVERTGNRSRWRGQYHLRQWRVSAMVVGAEYHSLCEDPGQCLAEEQPLLRPRAFSLSPRKQQLSLPCRPATQLDRKLTIGLDLGDRSSWYCVLDEAGEVLLEQKVGTTPKAMQEVFGGMPRSRIALETGMC
jgi:hypothetical protein